MRFEEMINSVICEDYLTVMRDIPDKSIDIVITDPPYNISNGLDIERSWRPSNITKDFGTWDKNFNPMDFLEEAVRICKRDIIVFTSSVLFGTIHDWLYPKYKYCKYIVWDKTNPSPSIRKKTWRQSTELIIHAHNDDIIFLDQFKMRNILRGNTAFAESEEHPAQKPVWIIKELLNRVSRNGDIVVDPFLGSGTTALACKDLGRRFIGIEKEQRYVDIANERLRIFDMQPKLNLIYF